MEINILSDVKIDRGKTNILQSPIVISTLIIFSIFIYTLIIRFFFNQSNRFLFDLFTLLIFDLGIVVISIIPFIIYFKNYFQTRITEFLIFGLLMGSIMIFGFVAILLSLIFDEFSNEFLFAFNRLVNSIMYFIIAFYFMRAIWVKIPKKFLYPVILLVSVNFIIEIQIFFCLSYFYPEFLRPHVCTVYPVSDFVFILEWLEQIVFLFVIFVLLILKAYKTLKPSIYHTSRLLQSLIYWQLILILLIPWAIITTLDIAIHSLLFKFNIDLFHENYDIFINSMQFPLLFVIILLLSYISIRYPEGVLIFEAQLQRTINSYSIIKSKGKEYKFSVIQEYISYIHEEFFE